MALLLKDYYVFEKEVFQEDLRPKYILPFLVDEKVLTQGEQNQILEEATVSSQIRKFFDILFTKQPEAILSLIDALKEEDSYPWLAERLENRLWEEPSEHVNSQLAVGGLPFPPNHFVLPRKASVAIRNGLILTANQCRGFVVLHGMIGCGKTVLAAEAVRDNHIFNTYFQDGIFWIPVGMLKAKYALLHIMDILFDRLNIEKQSFVSEYMDFSTIVSLTTDYLKKCIHKKQRKILIILDDVWDKNFEGVNVISAFDVGVPIMITTQVKSVMDNYFSFSTFIDCGRGLVPEESIDLISRYVQCRQSELPNIAKELCSRCKGSPLMLSRIGAVQRPYGADSKRWMNLDNKLKKGFLPLRRRHSSGDLKTLLKDVIKCCLEPLTDCREYFKYFVVFLEDVTITSKVLEVYWDVDEETVEDIMLELFTKSLVMRERDPKNLSSFCYGIHDLYLEILKEEENDKKVFHKQLTDNYLKLCKTKGGNFDFGSLPTKDDYIYHYIGYHLDEAQEYETLKTVYLDLNFIHNKISISGPGDLLCDYELYSHCFKNNLDELKDYENFVRRNGSLIYEKSNDAIQLALFEPTSSAVHKQAREKAIAKPKEYYEWCNQDDNRPYTNNLNMKSTSREVKHAVFSPNSEFVATAGENVLIWISSTGDEIQTLYGHTDVVNFCTFNTEGDRLATASADATVKIFEVDLQLPLPRKSSKGKRNSFHNVNFNEALKHDTSIQTFYRHEKEVMSVCYSPDDSLLISSDISGTIYVYKSDESLLVKHRIQHEKSLSVHLCLFSRTGTEFATASRGKIKLWDTKTGEYKSTINHDDMFVSGFCFTPKGNILSCYNTSISEQDCNGNQLHLHSRLRSSVFSSCALSPDGNYFACGTSKSSVFVWNINSWKIVANLKGHRNTVLQVMFSSDGTKLLSQSSDTHVIHDMTKMPDSSMICQKNILSVQYDDELYIASLNDLNIVEVRTGYSGSLKCRTPDEVSDITTCSLSNDCTEIAYGTKSGSVKVFNLSSNILSTCLGLGHSNKVTFLIHKQNDHTFFTCSEDKKILVWKNLRAIQTLKGHRGAVVMCVPFKKSKKLLSCSEDGTMRIWCLESDDEPMVLEGHGNERVTFCDISSDETKLASASSDCSVKIWNASNGTEHRFLQCDACVRSIRFSPFSTELVLGTDSGTVKLWNFKNNETELICQHDSWVNNILFSSNGSQIITVSDCVKLWDSHNHSSQALSLPGTSKCVIWGNADFEVLVLIHNSILYVLKKIG